jgi:hypothetical protein
MPTKTHGQGVSLVRNVKIEIPTRKFQRQTNGSLAFLQPRRRERLPLELVAILQALTGEESGPIVFTAKQGRQGFPINPPSAAVSADSWWLCNREN